MVSFTCLFRSRNLGLTRVLLFHVISSILHLSWLARQTSHMVVHGTKRLQWEVWGGLQPIVFLSVLGELRARVFSFSSLSSPSSTTASPLIISYSLCESSSLEETHSPYLISHWPLAACDVGVGPCGGRSTGAVIMLVLFRQTLLRVHGYIFLCHAHMSMGQY